MPGRVPSTEFFCRLALFACLVLPPAWMPTRLSAQPLIARTQHASVDRDRPVLPSELTGNGRIYLLQLGTHKQPYEASQFAVWLHEKYSLDVQVLSPTWLDATDYDPSRKMYVAERILAQIKREHAGLAADPKAFLIGFTDAAMYEAAESYDRLFSVRGHLRSAIISSDGMDEPSPDGTNQDSASLLRDRLRRILLKDVAVLFWHLPTNNNPQSILHWTLDADTPKNDLYESDLHPQQSGWGEAIASPCIVFSYKPGSHGSLEPQHQPLIRECEHPESAGYDQSEIDTPDAPPDTAEERMEVRLSDGIFTVGHTDFFLPGKIPIRLERSGNNVWQEPTAFGIGGSHNYDRFLSTDDGMRAITIGTANRGYVTLDRVPADLPVVPLNKWVDPTGSENTLVLKWRTSTGDPHFYLTRDSGEVETYMPCIPTGVCYFSGYRSPAGDTLDVVRDSQRNLMALSAPGNKWLHFSHEPAPNQIQVSEIQDSAGRHVLYRYNADGRLSTVTYPSGEVFIYGYDENHDIQTVAVTEHPGSAPITLVTNTFEEGKLTSQTVAGRTYTYSYFGDHSDNSDWVRVVDPDGNVFDICLFDEYSIVRQE